MTPRAAGSNLPQFSTCTKADNTVSGFSSTVASRDCFSEKQRPVVRQVTHTGRDRSEDSQTPFPASIFGSQMHRRCLSGNERVVDPAIRTVASRFQCKQLQQRELNGDNMPKNLIAVFTFDVQSPVKLYFSPLSLK